MSNQYAGLSISFYFICFGTNLFQNEIAILKILRYNYWRLWNLLSSNMQDYPTFSWILWSSILLLGWILFFRTTDWNIYIQHFSLRLNPWQVWTCPTINYSIYPTKCGRPLSWRNLTWPLTFCLNYRWVRKWWNSSINFQTNLILIVILWPQQTTFLR